MDKQIKPADQWKLGGDCVLCRRKKYCRKQCSARKKAFERALYSCVNSRLGGDFMRMLNDE